MTSKGKGNFTSKRLLLADALQTYIKQSLKKKKVHKCTQTILGALCSVCNKDDLGTLQYRLKESTD